MTNGLSLPAGNLFTDRSIGKMLPPVISAFVASHRGHRRTAVDNFPLVANQSVDCHVGAARWRLAWNRQRGHGGFCASLVEGKADSVTVGLSWEFTAWSPGVYILIPGAVYAGNRFDAERRPYPPKPRNLGQRRDALLLDIGDIPRLAGGAEKSRLVQTSWDAAIPAIGLYFPQAKRGMLWRTLQSGSHGPIGYELQEAADRSTATLRLSMPGMLQAFSDHPPERMEFGNLESMFHHPENPHPVNLGAGASMSFSFELEEFDCQSVQELFDRLFATRETAGRARLGQPKDLLPFSEAFRLISEKHQTANWNEHFGFYQVGIPWRQEQTDQFWQNGWLGGGIASYTLLQDGEGEVRRRALRNFEFLVTNGISDTGLFKALMDAHGHWLGDGQGACGGSKPWVLARRQGECLYYALRHAFLLRNRGEHPNHESIHNIRRVAATLCDIWRKGGDFGYLINYETRRVEIGGSTSGALIPAGLVLAARYFQEPDFLHAAAECAESFRTVDLRMGVTSGGPGDAAQAPDSEAAFGLIESFILLYEETKDAKWLAAAQDASAQAASWVMPHAFVFPQHSALAELGMDTRGVVFANAQNKCGVPGICTLSGEGLLRTYRASGDSKILDLLAEIAHAIPQFVSREDRPIPARIRWGHPLDALPPGWICERVNTTPSWPEPLGEQAAYSCWCEVAMMLTRTDLPGIYARTDTGLIRCLDHVDAGWDSEDRQNLVVKNSTQFPARVRILVENSGQALRPLPVNFAASLTEISIPAGGEARFPVSTNGAFS